MYIHDRKEVISRDVIFNKGKNIIKKATWAKSWLGVSKVAFENP
jgi:hypothetical protein